MRANLIADAQCVKLLSVIDVLLLIIIYQDFMGLAKKYSNS
jgi:hypothetical protein